MPLAAVFIVNGVGSLRIDGSHRCVATSPDLPDDLVADHVAAGRLVAVLDDWATRFPAYHLDYASRSASPPVALVVEALHGPAT